MALFIRDAEMAALAEQLRKLTKAKTEAVRQALRAKLAEARQALPLKDRLARSKSLADALGPDDLTFDMKAHSDGMWGDSWCLRCLGHRGDPGTRSLRSGWQRSTGHFSSLHSSNSKLRSRSP